MSSGATHPLPCLLCTSIPCCNMYSETPIAVPMPLTLYFVQGAMLHAPSCCSQPLPCRAVHLVPPHCTMHSSAKPHAEYLSTALCGWAPQFTFSTMPLRYPTLQAPLALYAAAHTAPLCPLRQGQGNRWEGEAKGKRNLEPMVAAAAGWEPRG